jgi:hypothetical protein
MSWFGGFKSGSDTKVDMASSRYFSSILVYIELAFQNWRQLAAFRRSER